MKKAIHVFIIGVVYFFAFIIFIPILTFIKAWMLGVSFDLLAIMPIAIKFGIYGATVVVVILALGAKMKK